MKELHYYLGTLGLSTSLILGITLYEKGWRDFRSFLRNVHNDTNTILHGIMGSALCGIGAHYLTRE